MKRIQIPSNRSSTIDQEENAKRIILKIKKSVEKDGIFDFERDIIPKLHRFLDLNPNALQNQIEEYYRKALEVN